MFRNITIAQKLNILTTIIMAGLLFIGFSTYYSLGNIQSTKHHKKLQMKTVILSLLL